jgi:SAM-dependent methyltransferase
VSPPPRGAGPDDYRAANIALWNELTGIHQGSAYYDVAGFLAGKSSLGRIESEELEPHVAGRSLLHLQCHFGLDTLSWARRGATVTGVDFSGNAIALARRLAAETGLPATFIESDVYELPRVLAGPFDIVFTSWGVLIWLPDLARWARLIADYLAPGGIFYIAEFHPFAFTLDDEADRPLVGRDFYFHRPEPHAWENDGSGSYADPGAHVQAAVQYEWNHPLGEIVTSLLDAGLTIDYLHEFPFTPGALDWPTLVTDAGGATRVRGLEEQFPVSFSLRATKT